MSKGNEPAFPINTEGGIFRGLTKREHVATQILAGSLGGLFISKDTKELSVRLAVEYADALLAELEKQK